MESARLAKVQQYFEEYLTQKGLRKTAERYHILQSVYERSDHFEAEQLYLKLKEETKNISKGTVYNTLELLLDAGLVVQHRFGKAGALYEAAYGYKQHDHLICLLCQNIYEFCDPRIQDTRNMMGEMLGFKVVQHSLMLNGCPQLENDICKGCNRMLTPHQKQQYEQLCH